LIEDRASGQSLIQDLKRDTRMPLLAIKVDSDKKSRAHAVTGLIEAGRVYLPERAPWLADFLDEISAFAQGAHDDQVDSMTQALNYMREKRDGVRDIWEAETARLQIGPKCKCGKPMDYSKPVWGPADLSSVRWSVRGEGSVLACQV
jgi:hypothetical protein